jgi:diaminohydroxyphosphoribosylaminopyrimidine deaminase/5-amino-6-(5-phosphoribosylamino)uracil reductase
LTDDERFMAAALALGRRGLGRTSPNPSVGALVVGDGIVVGRGWTQDGGRPHGETQALVEAGALARGATIYVTLEPCSHHGHTPPCCEAIVAAGITRLVYAAGDPNPLVAGQGAAYCRDHGLEVVGGCLAAVAEKDHRGHILRLTRKRPFVTLKLAETADGFVAGGPHDPRLSITGVAANGAVHVMRAMHDAIMVGIGTILADDPLMTVRLPGMSAKPLRIVLDARLRIPPQSRVVATAGDGPVLVLTGEAGWRTNGAALSGIPGVEIATVALTADGRIDLVAAMGAIAERGVTRLFSEGGPTIATALIEGALADDVLLFTAPRPLGGDGVPSLGASALAALADPGRYRLVTSRSIGVDRLKHYESVS